MYTFMPLLLPVCVALLTIAVSAAVLLGCCAGRPANAPPGPPLPLLWPARIAGNLSSLRHPQGPHMALSVLASKYGDVLRSVSMLGVVQAGAASCSCVHALLQPPPWWRVHCRAFVM